MKSIGIRELRQNASVYIRLVESGETVEIRERGRPVAMLTPVKTDETTRERLIHDGKLIPARNPRRGPFKPVPPKPGVPPLKEILQQMRDEERF